MLGHVALFLQAIAEQDVVLEGGKYMPLRYPYWLIGVIFLALLPTVSIAGNNSAPLPPWLDYEVDMPHAPPAELARISESSNLAHGSASDETLDRAPSPPADLLIQPDVELSDFHYTGKEGLLPYARCRASTCTDASCCNCDPNPCYIDLWLQQGYTGNFANPDNRFNGPLSFNDRSNEYQMNQLYLSLGRRIDPEACQWQLGGRADLLFGTDYFFVTSLGLETDLDGTPRWNGDHGPRAQGAALYGLAMPQLYAEMNVPWGRGLNVRLGHFYSLIGYESAMAANNFFYSHSYARQYGQPFTHTGVLTDLNLSKGLNLQTGFTRGWNSWDNVNGQLAFLGGLTWKHRDERTAIRFAIHTGLEDPDGNNNRTTYSLVWTQQLTSRMNYALEHHLGTEENARLKDGDLVDAQWYGITQYLTYCVSPRQQIGVRIEWFRDEDNARVLGIPIDGVRGGNCYQVSMGANLRPHCLQRFVIRPELRWDWSDVEFAGLEVGGLFDDFNKNNQLTWAISGMTRF